MTDKTDTTALVIAEELNEWARDYAPTELATALATCAAVLLKKQNARIAELEALQAAPPAPAAVAVPDGWRMVPIEPQDMQQAAGAQAIWFDTTLINKKWTANKVYREMVAGAPECAALAAAPAQAVAVPAAEPPEYPPMPEAWNVVASANGESLLSIGHDWLSGKGELNNDEKLAVVGMAQHMLAFVGYGLPPSNFDPDEEHAQAVPTGEEVLQLRMLVLDAICALETVPVTVSCGLDPSESAKASAENIERKLASIPAQEHATPLAGQGQWKEQGYASEAEYAADMQAVGEALIETIASNYASLQAAGWERPMDSPAEIVVDLLNLLDEAKAAAPAQAQEDARDALTLEELDQLDRAIEHFVEGEDTDVNWRLLTRAACLGFLECERFTVPPTARAAIDAARAAQGGA